MCLLVLAAVKQSSSLRERYEKVWKEAPVISWVQIYRILKWVNVLTIKLLYFTVLLRIQLCHLSNMSASLLVVALSRFTWKTTFLSLSLWKKTPTAVLWLSHPHILTSSHPPHSTACRKQVENTQEITNVSNLERDQSRPADKKPSYQQQQQHVGGDLHVMQCCRINTRNIPPEVLNETFAVTSHWTQQPKHPSSSKHWIHMLFTNASCSRLLIGLPCCCRSVWGRIFVYFGTRHISHLSF